MLVFLFVVCLNLEIVYNSIVSRIIS